MLNVTFHQPAPRPGRPLVVLTRLALVVLLGGIPTLSPAQSASMPFPQFNSSYVAGTEIPIQVSVTTAGKTVSKVAFSYQDNFSGTYLPIGEDDTAPYSYNWTVPTPTQTTRSYQIRAVATFTDNSTVIANAGTGYNGITVYRTNYVSTRNWYVNASAPASNTAGTEALPFNTIQKAADRVAPGDTVFVMAGTYTGTSTNVVQIQRTGLANQWIVFTPYKTDKPVVSMGNNNWQAFNVLPAAAYVKVQGFEVIGNNGNLAATPDAALTLAKTQPGACEGSSPAATPIPKFNGNGIAVTGRTGGNLRPHHVVFANNTVHDCGGAGISAIEADYVTVEGNTSYNNSWYTVYGTSGLSIFNSWNYDNSPDVKMIVRNNRFYGNILKIAWNIGGTGTNCKFYDGNGIILDNNNAVKNPLGAYTGKFLIENNLSYLNGGRGINVNYTDNATILNNTTYRNGVSDGGLGIGIESEFIAQGATGIRVFNNIFAGRPGEKVTEVNNSSIEHNHNLTFEGTGTSYFTGNQNITGQDPQFVDAANGDFRLLQTSPAVNSGSSVAGQFSAKDLLGITRPQGIGVDRGAYELQGVPATITQQPGSGSSVCVGASVVLSVVTGGGAVTSYQWKKDGADVPGATSATLTLSNVIAANQGTYAVVVTGFNVLTSDPYVLTVSALPTATLTPGTATLTCATPGVTLAAGGGVSYAFSGGGTVENNNQLVVTSAGTYAVEVTDANGCKATDSATVSEDKTAPTATLTPSTGTLTCVNPTVTLTAGGDGTYAFTGGGTPEGSDKLTVNAAGTYTVSVTGNNGCTATASATITADLTPPPPPNVSSLTVQQGTPNVSLTVTNCPGTVSWNGTPGAASLTIPTAAVGTTTYAATCTVGPCTGPGTTVTVTVTAPPSAVNLSVWHKDGDNNQVGNNTIRPYLKLANEGSTPVAYSALTIRYYLTVEDFAPVTNLSVYWAQLGTSKVKMRYVALPQPRQGAFGYVEYSFDASAGNLAGNSNSGEIQTGVAKGNWTNVNEADDYSFAPRSSYTQTDRLTVYYNGTLVWGTEPAQVTPLTSLKVLAQNKQGGTNEIKLDLKVISTGTLPLDYSQLTLRYWFTSEGTQPLNYTVDYAELGNGKVKGKIVREARQGTDTYLEVSFVPALGQLYPLSSTGIVQQRVNKSDWSNFNQTNDYSYQSGNSLAENAKITAYLNGMLVWGTEPGQANSRMSAEVLAQKMTVTVLGNPVVGHEVLVDVRGAERQPLRAEVLDATGRRLGGQQVEAASETERLRLPVGDAPGLLLLRVSTPVQSQTVKILKP